MQVIYLDELNARPDLYLYIFICIVDIFFVYIRKLLLSAAVLLKAQSMQTNYAVDSVIVVENNGMHNKCNIQVFMCVTNIEQIDLLTFFHRLVDNKQP
jgi:hypothetical protein